ncbi:hypothetical protein Vadar_030504 [Vaccinium darrowii]|uniref:Uncharacterized protein n=1 Tax=Vaccinium darrowii TaxID=229202 RepID=A0ACB7XDZ5_9ERIC|nr:hypothetical protein Vadar_030504 [Vaccinium darrowii]
MAMATQVIANATNSFFSLASNLAISASILFSLLSSPGIIWTDLLDMGGSSQAKSFTGNLVINGPDRIGLVWSTNVSNPTLAKSSSAQLLDTGNLVLLDSNRVVVWQSFDHPTDTLLPYFKFGVDRKSGLNRFVTSWKSRDDPGLGEYSFKMDLNGSPQLFLYKGSDVLWRQDEVTLSYSIRNASIFSKMVLNESGKIERLTWHDNEHQWDRFASAPKDQCDSYNYCGPNGNCDPSNAGMGLFDCSCLPGFEPKSASDWYLREGSGGCVRKRGGHVCGYGEGFVKVVRAKVPNTWMARVNKSIAGLKECELECLRNCTCNGYASADVSHGDGSGGCVMWFGDLIDTRVFPSGGQDFYVRVDAVELEEKNEALCLIYVGKETTSQLLFCPIFRTIFEVTTFSWEEGQGGSYSGLCYCSFASHILLILLVRGEEKKSGYMSPEYAMEGLFSIKSDVFSFGVLLLEIISGRKNSSYYKDNSVNLIGHVRGSLAAPYMLFKVSGNHLLRRGAVDSAEGLKTTWRRQLGLRVAGLVEVTRREGRKEVWTVIRGPRAKDASRRKRCRRGPLEPS